MLFAFPFNIINEFMNIFNILLLNSSLLDIDECASQPCHIHANCINTPGAHQCVCKDGFVGDGLSCIGKSRSFP